MSGRKRVGVLISGRGSNMTALIDACKNPIYPAEISLVVSNNPDAEGLQKASEAGIATQIIDHKAYATREAFEVDLSAALRKAEIDLICCAGFMRLLTDSFVEEWRNAQINIHPSLLPAFRGLNTHDRAIAAGVRITGCTVHFVRTEMDSGPIIAQAAVPVLPDDTPDSLAARVLKAEHQLYPLALELISSGAARIEGERVTFTHKIEGSLPMIVPAIL